MSATLVQYLQQLRAKGTTHVPIDAQARTVLRELYLRGSAKAAPVSSPAPTSPPARSAVKTTSRNTTPSLLPDQPIAEPRATGSTAAEKIASLAAQCEGWQPAAALGTLRPTMVFSTGNPEAELMLVGEGPGYQEERQKMPFVGPAGQKLDAILKAMGLQRPDVYLTNVCKFRPMMRNQTTGNRKPTPAEMASTLPFLRQEIDIVRPAVIIALGATAAQGLLDSTDSVTSLRGQWHQFQGIALRVTYHPSYLLHRQEGLAEKRKVWEDMLAVMERLPLPISEKQRNYFL